MIEILDELIYTCIYRRVLCGIKEKSSGQTVLANLEAMDLPIGRILVIINYTNFLLLDYQLIREALLKTHIQPKCVLKL